MVSFGEISERLRRSTVQVHASRRGAGSGVIWEHDGTIVTNAHVAISETPEVELWDGRRFPARVTARDRRRDLAALSIHAPDLEPAAPADSSLLRPGALVIAVGNPLGFSGAITRGAIHGLGAVPGLGNQTWVQANVQLAPGNSGGPLADAEGRVVGINAMIWGGLGLAVPSNAVATLLRHGGGIEFGVTVQPVRWNGGFALLVLEVRPGGAAEAASIILGDVLLGADGVRFRSAEDLSRLLESGRDVVHLEFVRGERTRVRSVAVRLPVRRQAAA